MPARVSPPRCSLRAGDSQDCSVRELAQAEQKSHCSDDKTTNVAAALAPVLSAELFTSACRCRQCLDPLGGCSGPLRSMQGQACRVAPHAVRCGPRLCQLGAVASAPHRPELHSSYAFVRHQICGSQLFLNDYDSVRPPAWKPFCSWSCEAFSGSMRGSTDRVTLAALPQKMSFFSAAAAADFPSAFLPASLS